MSNPSLPSSRTTPQKVGIKEIQSTCPESDVSGVTERESSGSFASETADDSLPEVTLHRIVEIVKHVRSGFRNVETFDGNPVLLESCSKRTYAWFETWRAEHLHGVRTMLYRGRILLEEALVGRVHEAASFWFAKNCAVYNSQATGDVGLPLLTLGSTSEHLNDGTVEPDQSFQVYMEPDRGCPNVVVEVGNIQCVQSLHRKAVRYLTESDNIMVVVCVKIYGAPNNGTMVIWVYCRNAHVMSVPVEAVSFGPLPMTVQQVQRLREITGLHEHNLRGYFVNNPNDNAVCAQRNMPTYRLTLPRYLLLAQDFDGDVIGPENAQLGDWEMDLFFLQRDIIIALRAMGRYP